MIGKSTNKKALTGNRKPKERLLSITESGLRPINKTLMLHIIDTSMTKVNK